MRYGHENQFSPNKLGSYHAGGQGGNRAIPGWRDKPFRERGLSAVKIYIKKPEASHKQVASGEYRDADDWIFSVSNLKV